MPPRVVVAVDKFRGSVTAREACNALAAGIRSVAPHIEIAEIPMADGGEGTLDTAVQAGFERRTDLVTDPLGSPVSADWGLREGDSSIEGIIEASLAAGLELVPETLRDPTSATSFGVGQLILAALDAGVTRLTLAVGGTACTDGGAGMLRALGARFLDGDGDELEPGGAALLRLAKVELSGLDRRLSSCDLLVATDVDNPLIGKNGAARVFAAQKGATAAEVEVLDAGMMILVDVLARTAGSYGSTIVEDSVTPGAGAGGGLGFAALGVLKARRISGGDFVMELANLDLALDEAVLVVTGEGCLDEQSLGGKTPLAVARAAARAGVPVSAVCGVARLTPAQCSKAGFQHVHEVSARASSLADSMARAAEILAEIGADLGADFRCISWSR